MLAWIKSEGTAGSVASLKKKWAFLTFTIAREIAREAKAAAKAGEDTRSGSGYGKKTCPACQSKCALRCKTFKTSEGWGCGHVFVTGQKKTLMHQRRIVKAAKPSSNKKKGKQRQRRQKLMAGTGAGAGAGAGTDLRCVLIVSSKHTLPPATQNGSTVVFHFPAMFCLFGR